MPLAAYTPAAMSTRSHLVRRIRLLRSVRGFTLVEMLAVVVIIGILTVAAAPSFVRTWRDRRVAEASDHIANVIRVARARALGRGAAVLVRWNKNGDLPTDANPEGQLTVREAIQGGADACAPRPSQSCFTTDWSAASLDSKHVMRFDTRSSLYANTDVVLHDPDNASREFAEICFTPRGRTFVRYTSGADSGVFEVLTGVPYFEVRNTTTTFRRQVVLPPSGVARVETRIN